MSGSCVKKGQALTSFLSMLSAVHHLWGVPVLKVCVMSVFTSSKTSCRGTNRAMVYLVCHAEVISITIDGWVRTGVLAYVGSVLLLGRGFRLCVSRLAVLSEGWGRDLSRFGEGGDLLSQGIWLIRSAWLKHIIRHTTEVWVGVKYPVMPLSSVAHQGVWAGQQEGEMANMCEVIQDSWPAWKTGGRGSSQTSQQLCRATSGS